MRERMDTTTPERNEYEHRYKDNQVEGVLRDPIEKEKGLFDRSVDLADNRVNGEPSYREDQVALMWYTGTFKDGASELSVERIQVDHKTSIPYIGDPENSLPINVRPGCDYLGASWLYTKINLSRRPEGPKPPNIRPPGVSSAFDMPVEKLVKISNDYQNHGVMDPKIMGIILEKRRHARL
ncbi:hypothetical protein F5882DRAFT_380392 [Hyaloscypha sp. PMI_1271]|nr:hypothetical protein F5882DRAFT_380392 [Hyaloscypha sp. PMI_1271]